MKKLRKKGKKYVHKIRLRLFPRTYISERACHLVQNIYIRVLYKFIYCFEILFGNYIL